MKRYNTNQNLANWARRNRPLLVLACVLVPLLSLLGLVLIEPKKSAAIIFLLTAFFLLTWSFLVVGIAQIIELLKATRSELMMIRAHIDRGLLDDIASDLAALRARMDKGVFGLLGS